MPMAQGRREGHGPAQSWAFPRCSHWEHEPCRGSTVAFVTGVGESRNGPCHANVKIQMPEREGERRERQDEHPGISAAGVSHRVLGSSQNHGLNQ